MKPSDLSLKMREKFVDDFRLPIKILESPYFEYFMDLYKVEFKIENKLKKFCTALDTLKEEGMQKEWYRVKDKIKEDVQKLPKYQELEKTIFEGEKSPFEGGNPYNMDYDNKTCVSIDIIAGNYSALKMFDPSLVKNTHSYKEFISLYTDFEYLHDSKIFRQLIFEPLLAKKQGQIQKRLIVSVANSLKEVGAEEIKTVSNDEAVLVFDNEDPKEMEEKVKSIVDGHEMSEYLKVEGFKVRSLSKNYFYKENADGSFLLRKAPASLYPQLFKKVKNLPLVEEDLLFIDGETKLLATWKKPFLL